jgi:dolichyl-phosphate-mannose-protein mannosyltransferase
MSGVSTQVLAPPSTPVPDPTPPFRRESLPRWGWLAILTVTALGGLLRFWRLDRPHQLVFDETYYVKQGYSMFKAGYELKWTGTGEVVDPQWNAGNINVFTKDPDFVVHPPVGKWMIGAGEQLFGPTSAWGWRFSAALIGTLSILMLALIAHRLFNNTLLAITAALLLAVDGEHYVHSRTGLLDIFVMFWALAAFGCLLIDRDDGIRRLNRRIASGRSGRLGPGLGLRWWRVAGAVCLGLCIGTKWSGLYIAVIFGLLAVFWDAAARRAAGLRQWWAGALLRDGLFAVVVMAPVALAVYLASWTGWFLSDNGYDRQWAGDHPSAHVGWVPESLRSLWFYHTQMYDSSLSIASSHPFEANPWSWLILGRPTAFLYDWPKFGEKGCAVAQCSQSITAIGNPVIWWGATAAIAVLLFQWALRRDWRAGAILAGLVAGYLPWFHYQQRTIFSFYSIVFVPWVVLALTYLLGMMLGPPGQSEQRRRRGASAAGAVVVLAVLVFWFFLPLYSAQVIPRPSFDDRMWLPSWL